MTTPTPPSDLIERAIEIIENGAVDVATGVGTLPAGERDEILRALEAARNPQAAYAVVRERIETLEGLLWRAIDDASIDPDTWYAEARSALKQRIDP